MTPPRPAVRLVLAAAVATTLLYPLSPWPAIVPALAWVVAALRVGMRLEHDEWDSLDLAVIVEEGDA